MKERIGSYEELVVALTVASPSAWAGPVILAGHDADDHGFTGVYADLFDALYAAVANGQLGILAIGADSPSTAATWITTVESLMTVDQGPVDFVNGAAAIGAVDFSTYSILFIPSDFADTPGGITAAENTALVARSAAIATFINGGGGLFGLTQGELADAWAYLGGLGAITTLDVPPSGLLPSGGAYDNVTPTAAGAALGITAGNIDGCCWHNVFTSFPAFLTVLATANEPATGDEAFDGEASVIGGATVEVPPPGEPVIPEPATLLLFGLGGACAGLVRRRRQLSKV